MNFCASAPQPQKLSCQCLPKSHMTMAIAATNFISLDPDYF